MSQQPSQTQPSRLQHIAHQFARNETITKIEPLGNGNINSTFLVTLAPSAAPQEDTSEQPDKPPARARFVMQQINTQIFTQPERVMQNMSVLSKYLKEHPLKEHHQNSDKQSRRWEIPHILPTNTDKSFFIDSSGNYWRAITFIEDSQVFETVKNTNHAKEVGYGLAMFHRLINGLSTDHLADTLEGFHITPTYLAHYKDVLTAWNQQDHSSNNRPTDIQHCLSFISQRQDWASVLEEAKAAGHLKLRPIHGDPKVNNIMFSHSGQAVGLIDLDTLKPGLVHYDIGDCLRSGCNPTGEETKDWQSVKFDLALAKAMLEGYLSIASNFLTEQDYDYLYDAIRLIAFELGLRFFTDYLAGNTYFKVEYDDHNLDRALVQFQLTSSIESQETQLKNIIESLK